jgi:peptidoglycan/LPS O-acetylase OafA/YrhL
MKPSFYRPELDSLRFVAFFAVFLCHTLPDTPVFYTSHHFPHVLGGLLQAVSLAGAYGVDLFFLLSSYLITELLLRERDATGRLDVIAFYKRRILRIWPLYFTFIGIGWALTLIDKTEQLPVSYIAAYLLLAGNWISAIKGHPNSVISILWSVSIEEQFYLLWPLVVRKARIINIASVAVLLLVTGSVCRFLFLEAGWTEGLWKNTLTRMEPMALGILIAVFGWKLERRLLSLVAGVSCLLLVAAFSHLNFSRSGTMIGYPLIAASVGLIFLGWNHSDRLTIYLGQISYGLYVFHMLGIRIGVALLGKFTSHYPGFVAFWFFSLALTILMASISYFVLEKPFLRLKSRYAIIRSRDPA